MPKKRRNNGRNKANKGNSIKVNCNNCTRLVPKDKAIKRFIIKNMVDGSSKRDIEEASAYAGSEDTSSTQMPKLFVKNQWCVSCGIHARVVKVRSTEDKRIRYVSKYRSDKKAEMTNLYRVANQKFLETNNPFAKKANDDEE